MAAAPEDMEGVMEQAEKCELGTASCCLFEDRDGKLKHQQDKIEHQKTRIEALEAKVKSFEHSKAVLESLDAQAKDLWGVLRAEIKVLEAKVKKQEAHLFQWRKYPQEMHASLSHKPARKSEPEGLSGSVKKAKRQAEQIASAAREAYTYTPEYRSIVHAERVLYPDYPDDAGAPEHRPPARLVWGNQLFKGN